VRGESPAVAAAALAALLAGLATAVQAAANGGLGRRIGVLEAVGFSVMTTAVIISIVLLARGSLGAPYAAFRHPPWLWHGGVMGLVAVSGIAFAPPRIGVYATIALLIGGQLAASVVIDAFGLLGVERTGLNPARAAGVVLVVVGALLALRR
jgi:transporter family-2 protein